MLFMSCVYHVFVSVHCCLVQDGPGLCFCQEFGVSVRSSEKGDNPGSAGSEFGEITGITLVRQVRSSEKGQFLSPNPGRFGVRRKNQAQPWYQVQPWLGRFGVRRKDRAEPWFGRFGVRRKDRAEPWFGRLRVQRKTGYLSKLRRKEKKRKKYEKNKKKNEKEEKRRKKKKKRKK